MRLQPLVVDTSLTRSTESVDTCGSLSSSGEIDDLWPPPNTVESHLENLRNRWNTAFTADPGLQEQLDNGMCTVGLLSDKEKRELLYAQSWGEAAAFQNTRLVTEDYSCDTGAVCAGKNRYSNLLPYDYNCLSTGVSALGHSYINGSRVCLGDQHPLHLLLTQGPMDVAYQQATRYRKSQTVDDFWELIAHEKPGWVVSLADSPDDPYWAKGSDPLHDGSKIVLCQSPCNPMMTEVREFQHKNGKTVQHAFHHVLFKGWPDHGIPEPKETQELVKLAIHLLKHRGGKPILIHCNAGIGRTGTFALLLKFLHEIDLQLKKGLSIDRCEINPLKSLFELRMQRKRCVEKPQWDFLLKTITTPAQQLDTDRKEKENGPFDNTTFDIQDHNRAAARLFGRYRPAGDRSFRNHKDGGGYLENSL